MLAQIPSCPESKAKAIVQAFPTLRGLYTPISRAAPGEGEKLLIGLGITNDVLGAKAMSTGKAMAKKVVACLLAEDPGMSAL
jgi:hypothetical protein